MRLAPRAILAAVLFTAFGSAAFAQSLEQKKEDKLKSEFLKKATWILDYDQAREEAKKTGKPIFGLFSRSYEPCPACHQLENGPLLTDDFAKFSKDYVLYFHITTMIPEDKNGGLLLEKTAALSFPTILYLDNEGKVIAIHSDGLSIPDFMQSGQKAREYVGAKSKADQGDASAKIELIILRLGMGKIKVEDAKKQLKEAGTPTKEQQVKFDTEALNAFIMESTKDLEGEELIPVAKKFYEMYKAGNPYPTGLAAMQAYFIPIMGAAERARDLDTYVAVLKILKDKFGALEGARLFFQAKERRLEELKAEKK